jgi:hypothetical protein
MVDLMICQNGFGNEILENIDKMPKPGGVVNLKMKEGNMFPPP